MSHRFYCNKTIRDDRVNLDGQEAHHLLHVLRCRVGDVVTLFDGSGAEVTAEVLRLHRSSADLAVLARHEIDRELPFPLTLGIALPKGDRQRWLIEKAVELGVSRIVPLNTSRSVAQPTGKAVERLRRAVIEASKQCGRNRLMEICPPQSFASFLRSGEPDSIRLIAHPSPQAASVREFAASHRANTVRLGIGPEGGFADEEAADAIAAGWHLVSFGPRILRIETAAIALVSAFCL